MSYWTSPAGVLRRARDKANPYKRPESIDAFRDGWASAAGKTDRAPNRGAYARGWNARIDYETTQRKEADDGR